MKKTWSSLIVSFASLLVLVPSLRAQAVYTAEQKTRIQVGGGAMALSPDYAQGTVIGFSAWGDYDFSKHIGIEASAHFGEFITPGDTSENTYLIGPRFSYRRGRLTAYGKALVGRGTITNLNTNGSSSYNLYGFGGGVEYRLLRKVNIRVVDFEQQKWPDFGQSGLTPIVASIGASYIIH
jgi:hypothetical protein